MTKVIKPEVRAIIMNVLKICDIEKNENTNIIPISKANERAVALSGVSMRTIMRIRQEMANMKPPPKKKYKVGRRKKFIPDNLNICNVRHTIMRLHHSRGVTPSLRSVLPVLVREGQFNGSREMLRNLLHTIGYTFKLQDKNRRMVENVEISSARKEFLREISVNRKSVHSKSLIFVSEFQIKLNEKKDSPQWNIINASTEYDLSTNLVFVYKYDRKEEKEQCRFVKWLKECLLPTLDQPCLVAVPNYLYNKTLINKPPTVTDSKEYIIEWLKANEIKIEQKLNKAELLACVSKEKQAPVYEIEELFYNQGYIALQIPDFHSDLNPHEILWNSLRKDLGEIAEDVSATEIYYLVVKLLDSISNEEWLNICANVRENELKYLLDDQLIEKCT